MEKQRPWTWGIKADEREGGCGLRHCGIRKGIERHRISHVMKGRPEGVRNIKYRK